MTKEMLTTDNIICLCIQQNHSYSSLKHKPMWGNSNTEKLQAGYSFLLRGSFISKSIVKLASFQVF